MGVAAEDPFVGDHEIPGFSLALGEKGVTHQLVTHADTEHGYSFPERPSYAQTAAEKDWTAMFEMFGRTLT